MATLIESAQPVPGLETFAIAPDSLGKLTNAVSAAGPPAVSPSTPAAFVTQTLSGWRWRQCGKKEDWHLCSHSRPATEIYTDLLDAKIIPDPFLDENEKLVQWVADEDWEYECDFVYEPNKAHKREDLVFDGLDTFASVYLNDTLILESSNMFHRHRIDVSDKLKMGPNCLRIVFRSALREGLAIESRLGKRQCFGGDRSRVHVRKAQYHYGWDWGPILLTCGPYRPIHLEAYDSMIHDVWANAIVADDLQQAELEVLWEAVLKQDVAVQVTVTSPSGLVTEASSKLPSTARRGKVSVQVPKPELWYPVNRGPQVFYSVTLQLFAKNGTLLQETTTDVGVRRLRLVQQPLLHEPGTSFYFEINNQPVYVSGSNWIPRHSFLTALAPEDYAADVKNVLQSNQNMLRIWGGGVYEHDALYKECDRRGLLVWQDFMFACGIYPCHEEFAASVKREAIDQVKRLRQYCSIVLYAGNNEDYQGAEILNLDWDKNNNSGDWTNTNFPARTIYETYLPNIVSEYASGVPYHPGSPWGGKDTEDRTVGDIHQWNVWHGTQEKYQMWDKLTGRFVSEFGMLAFPSERSICRYVTDPAQRYPQSAVLDLHNKAEGAERRLALYVLENIRVKSMSLKSWIYATQLVQAECLSFAISSCRRRWKGPRREYCGGQLVWQINDCWPVSSWAIVDFYGERKLAFYAIKRHSAPLTLGMHRSTPDLKKLTSPPPHIPAPPHDLASKEYVVDLWAANATVNDVEAAIEVRLFDIGTGELRQTKMLGSQQILANQSTELLEDCKVDNKTAVQAILRDRDGKVISRASDWPQPLKYVSLPTSYDIQLRVLDGKVEIRSNAPTKAVELSLADASRHITWEDNGVDVFPGDAYTVLAPGLLAGDKVDINYYGLE